MDASALPRPDCIVVTEYKYKYVRPPSNYGIEARPLDDVRGRQSRSFSCFLDSQPRFRKEMCSVLLSAASCLICRKYSKWENGIEWKRFADHDE